jgi:nucleoside-diphosphate-sugar epimerase
MTSPLVERRPPSATTIVTGASGWLGRALIRSFTDSASPLHRVGTVRALIADETEREVLDSSLSAAGKVQVFVGDISDPGTADTLLRGARDASVIHTAAVIHPKRAADFQRVNVDGTSHLLDAAVAERVRRVVYVSSNSPFGFNADAHDRFRADEPFAPFMGYGRSKMEAELLVRSAEERGIDAVIVRPPWFYGPWQPERQTSFFRMVRRGRFPLLGNGLNARSMVYIDNLVDGVDAADRVQAASGGAFWIADARAYTMNEVIASVRAALTMCGVPPLGSQRRFPKLLGSVARLADCRIQASGRYVQEAHVLGEMDLTIACDISRSREVLGYEPKVALLEGMIRSIEWCLARNIEL